jgi:WD40 repeat protein
MGRSRSRAPSLALSALAVLFTWGAHPASARLATPGAQVWEKRYNGPGNADDSAGGIAVSPDGTTVFVTGRSIGSIGSYDYATAAYDASTGARRWIERYDGPGKGPDVAYAVAVSPDGSKVFVTGAATDTTGFYNYVTIAYQASTGARLWVSPYNGPGSADDTATALGVNPDGTILFVTGRSVGSSGTYDYATVAYRASTGDRLWISRFNGAGSGYDVATALGVSPDGGMVFVTGGSTVSTGVLRYATLAYRASTGARLWVKRFNGQGNGSDLANAIGVSPDGSSVFVTGYSSGPLGDSDFVTVAYQASTGAGLWIKRFGGPANGSDAATALGVSPDGSSVFVTGHSAGATGSSHYATIAYTASTGARLWVKRYDGPGAGNDFPYALAVSPDGSGVFVTGYATGPTGSLDYGTVAYQASTGARLWVQRYNGPDKGDDIATAVGVSADGSMVFVTGGSTATAKSDDIATLAYSTS